MRSSLSPQRGRPGGIPDVAARVTGVTLVGIILAMIVLELMNMGR